MKKLLTTLGLCMSVLGGLAAGAPAQAGPLPPNLKPNLRGIQLPPAPQWFAPNLLRAELSSYLYSQPVGAAYPGWKWVICFVRNSGVKKSGPFITPISGQYANAHGYLPQHFVTKFWADLDAGQTAYVYFPVYVPPTRKLHLYSKADVSDVVVEYEEMNNEDKLWIFP